MKNVLLYVIVLTIPLCLGLREWQSAQYAKVFGEMKNLEQAQEEWIENNKRLIARIAILSSSERIENMAKNELGLEKKTPEETMQIKIEGTRRIDG